MALVLDSVDLSRYEAASGMRISTHLTVVDLMLLMTSRHDNEARRWIDHRPLHVATIEVNNLPEPTDSSITRLLDFVPRSELNSGFQSRFTEKMGGK